MSKLGELIQELCPNGVEYKTLGEIAIDIYRGSGIKRDEVTETGMPCVRYGEIYTTYDIWFEECVSHTIEENISNRKYFEHGDILFAITGESVEEIAKSCAYIGKKKCLAGGDIVVLKHNQDAKYLSYALSTTEAQEQKSRGKVKSKVVHSSVPAIKEIVVPVPPLDIQREIVRILDNFKELTAELTAELEFRKKQYEYYRNELFKFNTEITYVALGDICDVMAGGTPSKQRKEYWDNGTIKWLGSTVCKNQKSIDEITDYITKKGFEESSAKMMKKNTTLIALVGATIGKVAFLPFEATINQNIAGVYPKDTKVLDPDYLYYACAGLYSKFTALTQNSKLTIANLSFVRSLQIPVPSPKVQKRIVNVLDRFDILCNDLANGLIAEIEARQKQYEYYRDKLLTFKELSE